MWILKKISNTIIQPNSIFVPHQFVPDEEILSFSPWWSLVSALRRGGGGSGGEGGGGGGVSGGGGGGGGGVEGILFLFLVEAPLQWEASHFLPLSIKNEVNGRVEVYDHRSE